MVRDQRGRTFNKQDADSLIQIIEEPSAEFDEYGPPLTPRFFFGFELTSAVTTGTPSTATAKIVEPDDESTEIETGVTLTLNYAMFDDLASGDKGICVKSGGKYYAVNAPCGT